MSDIKHDFYKAMKRLEGKQIKEVVMFDPNQDTCKSFRIDTVEGDSVEIDSHFDDNESWVDMTVLGVAE